MAGFCTPIRRQQSTNEAVWVEGDKREDNSWGWATEKVKVEAIWWRSLDLHSIKSKSTFCPLQSRKSTGTYYTYILGVRLSYWHHGKHVY
jgi:hypothetical protein